MYRSPLCAFTTTTNQRLAVTDHSALSSNRPITDHGCCSQATFCAICKCIFSFRDCEDMENGCILYLLRKYPPYLLAADSFLPRFLAFYLTSVSSLNLRVLSYYVLLSVTFIRALFIVTCYSVITF